MPESSANPPTTFEVVNMDLDERLAYLEKFWGSTVVIHEVPDDQGQQITSSPRPDAMPASGTPAPAAVSQASSTAVRTPSALSEIRNPEALAALKVTTFPEYNLKLGEAGPKEQHFCPWRMVKNYPGFFIGKTNRPKVMCPMQRKPKRAYTGQAEPFFDSVNDYQPWDL
jgi:hypothetical protein